MSTYRFCYINDGEVVSRAVHEFDDDASALWAAKKQMSAKFEIEIRRDDEFIARFGKAIAKKRA